MRRVSPSHFLLLPLASISSRSAAGSSFSSPCRRLHVSRRPPPPPPPQPRTTLREETRSNAYLVRASGIVQPSSSPPTSPPPSLERTRRFESRPVLGLRFELVDRLLLLLLFTRTIGPAITAILREGTMRRNCSRQSRGWDDDRLEAAAAATAATAAAAAGGGAADSSTGVVVYRNRCLRWRRKHARGVCTHPG